jgi:hypothetical protein
MYDNDGHGQIPPQGERYPRVSMEQPRMQSILCMLGTSTPIVKPPLNPFERQRTGGEWVKGSSKYRGKVVRYRSKLLARNGHRYAGILKNKLGQTLRSLKQAIRERAAEHTDHLEPRKKGTKEKGGGSDSTRMKNHIHPLERDDALNENHRPSDQNHRKDRDHLS